MTPADHARNAAISLEAKKDALAQRQSGDWKISFTVQGTDMDARLTKAAMGTRFAMVLVEIGDDELPVQKENRAQPRQEDSSPSPHPGGAKRNWRDIPPPQQAGIRCDEPAFAAFLKEQRPDDWQEEPDTVDCVYLICGITSRSELATNHKARVIWKQLDDQYGAWKALEHA
jgi:hypothetical protein